LQVGRRASYESWTRYRSADLSSHSGTMRMYEVETGACDGLLGSDGIMTAGVPRYDCRVTSVYVCKHAIRRGAYADPHYRG
jgi:hypothetical protein